MKSSIFIVFCFLTSNLCKVFAQVTAADCNSAVNICQNASFAIDPNGPGSVADFQSGTVSNPSINPGSSNSGCLLAGELNPTWMIINIAGSGNLQFSLGQDMGSGCFDWIMWPYSSNTCTQILNNQIAPVRCNWNGGCEGFTGIANPLPPGGDPSNFEPPLAVTAGQQFLLCMSNYSSQTTNVPLNFFGTANVSCNTVLPVTINNATICPGQSTTLTATAAGATSYLWSPGGETTASISVSPNSTTVYTCTVNGPAPNGGTSTGVATGTVTILSSNDPLCGCTVTASNNGPVCIGSTFNLNATNVNGGSYDWTLAGNSIGSTQNLNNLPAVNSGTFPITVTATDGLGHVCTSTTTLTVNPLPVVSAGSDVSVCLGNPVTLSGSGAVSYQWNGGVQNAVSFVPSLGEIYTVTGTDVNGCSNVDDVTVNILFAQNPSISSSATIGCSPLQVIFTNNDPLAQDCQWTFGNGSSAIGCNPQSTIFNQVGCYDVILSQTDAQGCDTTVTFPSIVCVEESIASFYLSPGIIGPGNNTVSFYNNSIGANSYQWHFGDGESSTLFEPFHEYDITPQTGYEVTLISFSPAGCPDTARLAVEYEEQLIFYVPNSFTPDADEHNQTFVPIFTSGFDPFSYKMRIYNRWGELIFQTYNLNEGWDGSFGGNGGTIQSGVYTWIIDFKPKNNDDKITVNGFVNVLK